MVETGFYPITLVAQFVLVAIENIDSYFDWYALWL
jgi:hypothetical protein